jgi:hypothetical protein
LGEEPLRDIKRATHVELQQIKDAWLNIDIEDKYIQNPIKHIPEAAYDEPYVFLTYMMSRPQYIGAFVKYIMGITILPYQMVFLRELWESKFPIFIASRGASKSWILALYCLLRAVFIPGRKIVICGSSFRQSKVVYEYMDKMFHEAPLLRDMVKGGKCGGYKDTDMWKYILNGSQISALPMGCVTEDTLITTDSGIYEIVELKDNPPQTIWGNKKHRDYGFFFDNGVHPTKTITTHNGYQFKCTYNHKIRVLEKGLVKWCRADSLKDNAVVLIDRSERWSNSEIEVPDAYPVGRMWNEPIPSRILCASKKIMSRFLSGLFDARSILYRDSFGDVRITLSLDSALLARQVHYVLLHYGIVGKLSSDELGKSHIELQYMSSRKFLQKIGYRDSGKKYIQDRELLETYIFDTDQPVFLDRIKSVEEGLALPTYDVNIPSGNEYCANGFFSHNTGEKIRGQRAQDLILDETKSVNQEIFEEVMSGFLAVSADPITNVQDYASRQKAEELNIFMPTYAEGIVKSNQLVMSGTAYYQFNHFYKYWSKWKAIIECGGDPSKLNELYGGEGIPEDFDYRDYTIIRFPYELVPTKFMDEAQIARTKSSISDGIYMNEFAACFASDSDGFFRRTLIESCVAYPGTIYKNKEDCYFEPRLYGDPSLSYVMGIDPASERDNFSIIILELHSNHRRLVYSWTTSRSKHQARQKAGLVQEHDFYSYVNRKVRDLMERFNIESIIIDSQGGGYAVIEAFKNEGNMLEHETPILEVRDLKKPKDSDRKEGHHIVQIASFADAKWFSLANHGMKKDMEDQVLIFPSMDALSLGLAIETADLLDERMVDTLQDCIEEIEMLKDELCTIIMKQSPSGREQFTTPESVENGKKGRQKKDRYSSLVIANMAAREIQNAEDPRIHTYAGGFAGNARPGDGPMYEGNQYIANKLRNAYDCYE